MPLPVLMKFERVDLHIAEHIGGQYNLSSRAPEASSLLLVPVMYGPRSRLLDHMKAVSKTRQPASSFARQIRTTGKSVAPTAGGVVLRGTRDQESVWGYLTCFASLGGMSFKKNSHSARLGCQLLVRTAHRSAVSMRHICSCARQTHSSLSSQCFYYSKRSAPSWRTYCCSCLVSV